MDREAFIDTIAPYYQDALSHWYTNRNEDAVDVIVFSESKECMSVFVVPSEDVSPILRESFNDPVTHEISRRILVPPPPHKVWILLIGLEKNALAQMDYRRHVYKRNN